MSLNKKWWRLIVRFNRGFWAVTLYSYLLYFHFRAIYKELQAICISIELGWLRISLIYQWFLPFERVVVRSPIDSSLLFSKMASEIIHSDGELAIIRMVSIILIATSLVSLNSSEQIRFFLLVRGANASSLFMQNHIAYL